MVLLAGLSLPLYLGTTSTQHGLELGERAAGRLAQCVVAPRTGAFLGEVDVISREAECTLLGAVS